MDSVAMYHVVCTGAYPDALTMLVHFLDPYRRHTAFSGPLIREYQPAKPAFDHEISVPVRESATCELVARCVNSARVADHGYLGLRFVEII